MRVPPELACLKNASFMRGFRCGAPPPLSPHKLLILLMTSLVFFLGMWQIRKMYREKKGKLEMMVPMGYPGVYF